MIFDQLNDLVFTKQRKSMTNIDHENDYSSYMINRWISMYSPDMANIINNTANWMYTIFETKTDHYNFLHAIIPRSARKRINYIKKKKPDKEEEEEDHNIELLARNLEISQREVRIMLDVS